MPISYDENIKDIKYAIINTNGVEVATIQSNAVSVCNIVYSLYDNKIFGDITFLDYDNIVSTAPILSEHKLKIYFKDKYNYESSQSFNISEIGVSLLETRINSVKFTLIDEYSFAFMRTNLGSGFNNVTMEGIIPKYVNLLKDTILSKKKIKYNTTKKHDSIIVTENKNFHEFLNYRQILDKVLTYHRKNDIHVCDFSKLLSNFEDKSDFVVFRPEHPSSTGPLKIYDCDILLLNKVHDVTQKPSRTDIFYNPHTKSVKGMIYNYSYKDMVKKVKPTGVLANINDCIGSMTYMREQDGTGAREVIYDLDILSNYIVEVTIKGLIQLDIGQIVGFQMMLPGTNIENKMVTGKWIVSRISEKLQGMCYVQKIRLITPTIDYKQFKELE